MIRFKDGKVDRRCIYDGETDRIDLADALDIAVAALRDIAGCLYIHSTGCPHEANEALRQIGADHAD